MTIHLTERQDEVLLAACEHFRQRKAEQLVVGQQNPSGHYKPLNSYDLLAPQHSMMQVLIIMEKLTGKPAASFCNPNPTQTAQTGNAG